MGAVPAARAQLYISLVADRAAAHARSSRACGRATWSMHGLHAPYVALRLVSSQSPVPSGLNRFSYCTPLLRCAQALFPVCARG